MRKILVIGSGGAGKSTFSRRLSERTGIEVFHLDKLYWKSGWVEPTEGEWRETVEKLLEKDEWILDGNFGGTADLRIEKCDTVILFDLPRLICLYRVIKRRLQFRGTHRPDMAAGCNEKIDFEFLSWIWNFPKNKLPPILKKLKQVENEKAIVRLRSPKEVEKFLNTFGGG